MSTDEMVEAVRQSGGVLRLEGDNVRCSLPTATVHFACELRERKPELVTMLKVRGGWVANLPRCPDSDCGSYYLYRENNVGTFECQTCGLESIDEATARRVV